MISDLTQIDTHITSYSLVVSCQSEFPPNYEDTKPPITTTEDIKPNYLLGYGPVTTSSETKSEYDPYYSKLQTMKTEGEIKIPKTEITTTSCCSVTGRNDLLVPKTEVTSTSCRSPSRQQYEPYMNQDSNSSSMSSMETLNSRGPHHQMQHHPAMGHQQSAYGLEDSRQQHHLSQRSPYHQSPMSEEMYHRSGEHALRPYAEISDSMGTGGVARPVVTYPNEMVTRSYDTSMVNSASHRPYDPGTATAFER